MQGVRQQSAAAAAGLMLPPRVVLAMTCHSCWGQMSRGMPHGGHHLHLPPQCSDPSAAAAPPPSSHWQLLPRRPRQLLQKPPSQTCRLQHCQGPTQHRRALLLQQQSWMWQQMQHWQLLLCRGSCNTLRVVLQQMQRLLSRRHEWVLQAPLVCGHNIIKHEGIQQNSCARMICCLLWLSMGVGRIGPSGQVYNRVD